MKKAVIAAVVLAAILLLAPNALGRFAESRSDAMLDGVAGYMPYVSIVERDWERGWFTSRQRVTFESNIAGEDGTRPRFTLHNDVLHGPLLGFSGLGAARVKTRIDLPPAVQAEIRKSFGPEPALEVTTRVGFLGGGSTVLRSQGRTASDEEGAEIRYETVKFKVDFNRDFSRFGIDGRLPRVEIQDASQRMVFDRMTMEGEADRIDGYQNLYATDFGLRIRELSVTGRGNDIHMDDVHYEAEVDVDEGWLTAKVRIGSDAVEGAAVETAGVAIRSVHYDLSLRHLHAQTVDAIYTSMQQMYTRVPFEASASDPQAVDAAIDESITTPLMQHAATLLAHDPELSLDRIGFTSSDGEAVLKGVVRLVGMSEQDFQFAGLLGALGKLQADLTLEIDEALAAKLPNGAFLSETGVAAGYLLREDGKLVSRIGFDGGALTVNGQTQALPFPGVMPGAAPQVQELP